MNYFDRVLTIGRAYNPPKGGIAQLLYNYKTLVYNPFYFVPNGLGAKSILSYIVFAIHPLCMVITFILHPRIKIVHIHTPSYKPFVYATVTAKIARLFNKRVVMHMHGGGFRDYYMQNKKFVGEELRKTDAVVVLSESWKKFYENNIGLKNVRIIQNIVPLPHKIKIEKNSKFILLFLGYICKDKGIFDLVECIKENHAEYRDKLMLYIGGGQYEENQLKILIEDNNLQDVITFCGWVSGENKINLLNKADAFILPSYKEALPISIIEAMTYGLPIISTEVGGIPELVEHGTNGLLFIPGDYVSMKQYIDTLMYNAETRKRMSSNSYKKSLNYLPENAQLKLNCLYKSLL